MQELRVDTAALPAMAVNWGASAAELAALSVPAGFGPSSQPGTIAVVVTGHADVAAYTTELATRVDTLAGQVIDTHASYIAGEARSTNELSAWGDSPTIL